MPVVQNRWRDAAAQLNELWTPRRTVSVVVPAYNAPSLDLTLASLAAQDYPSELLEVIVVDDGSDPAYELPSIRPRNTTVVTPSTGWGIANACNTGVAASTGEIIVRIDSDLVLAPDHIRQHLRWHDALPDVVTKGEIVFLHEWDLTPEAVFAKVSDGTVHDLTEFTETSSQWVVAEYERTDDLNEGGPRVFSILSGASISVSRKLFDAVGGFDANFLLGEDTEFGYRLAQAGAVFVPARDALCYHLGASTTQTRAQAAREVESVYYAQRAPLVWNRRTSSGRTWEVPLVRATVEVDTSAPERARSVVDRLLNGSCDDIRVDLAAPWSTLTDERRKPLDDPRKSLFLLADWYRAEARVSMVDAVLEDAFPSPFLLVVPPMAGFDVSTLDRLITRMDKERLGGIRIPVGDASIDLWRTAALRRARSQFSDATPIQNAVDAVWGVKWMAAAEFDVVDLGAVSTHPETVIHPRAHNDLAGRLKHAESAARSSADRHKQLTQELARSQRNERKLRAELKRRPRRAEDVRGAFRGIAAAVKHFLRVLLT